MATYQTHAAQAIADAHDAAQHDYRVDTEPECKDRRDYALAQAQVEATLAMAAAVDALTTAYKRANK